MIYRLELRRCRNYQHRYAPPLPPKVKYQPYDPTCDVTIALLKDGYGLPWTRMSAMHEMGGLPMPESVIEERSAESAKLDRASCLHCRNW